MTKSTIFTEISPEALCAETARFTSAHCRLVLQQPESAPWLVISCILLLQQATSLALKASGDPIPAQAGAMELVLRAASPARLPAPFTLGLTRKDRQALEALIEARNSAMHPRGTGWQIGLGDLVEGLRVTVRCVRHLILIQPIVPNLLSPEQADILHEALEDMEALADFLPPGST